MAVDRSKFAQQLGNRVQHNYNNKDAGSFKSIFKTGLDGVNFIKMSRGNHTIDIVPYIAGKFDPEAKEGEATYVLVVNVHHNIGPNNDAYLCLAKNYGQECPVCEYLKRAQQEGTLTKEEIKKMKAKKRAIYNVICFDNPQEEAKGVQVWNAPHYKMERILLEIAKQPESRMGVKMGGFVPFADPDAGKSIGFRIEGEGEATDYIGHKFVDRDYIIPDTLLEAARVLDELLHIPAPEEMLAALYPKASHGGQESGESKDAPVSARGLRSNAPPPPPVEEPPPAPPEQYALPGSDPVCPGGGTFGASIETLPDCGDCDIYAQCSDKKDKMLIEQRATGKNRLQRQATA